MKVVITGHTSGIGKSLLERYRQSAHVFGMSRSTGYDLSKSIDDFVLTKFDVYYNNAYCGFAQTDLLYKLFEANKDRHCVIVNTGSVSADGDRDQVNKYAIHKAALEKACRQLQFVDSNCKVVHIKLGRTRTPMTDFRADYPRMDPDYVASAMTWAAHQPDEILVKNLTLDIMHSRTKIADLPPKDLLSPVVNEDEPATPDEISNHRTLFFD